MNDAQASPATQTAPDRRPTGEKLRPASDLLEYVRQYARERPEFVALGCLGIGFVLGWKLKIW